MFGARVEFVARVVFAAVSLEIISFFWEKRGGEEVGEEMVAGDRGACGGERGCCLELG